MLSWLSNYGITEQPALQSILKGEKTDIKGGLGYATGLYSPEVIISKTNICQWNSALHEEAKK